MTELDQLEHRELEYLVPILPFFYMRLKLSDTSGDGKWAVFLRKRDGPSVTWEVCPLHVYCKSISPVDLDCSLSSLLGHLLSKTVHLFAFKKSTFATALFY